MELNALRAAGILERIQPIIVGTSAQNGHQESYRFPDRVGILAEDAALTNERPQAE